jgi:hypothetical protein
MKTSALRFFALLSMGLLVVHHLRFAFAHLGPAEQHDSAAVHSYLPFMLALIAVIAVAAAVLYVRDIALVRRAAREVSRPWSFGRLWALSTVLLLGSYVLQESLEALEAHDAITLSQTLSAHNGWTVLLLAPATAAVVALFARETELVLTRISQPAGTPCAHTEPTGRWRCNQSWLQPRRVLLRQLAGRAPPPASVLS